MNKVSFLNVNVDNVTFEESLDIIDRLIKEGGYHYVVTPNIDHIVKLEDDMEFKNAYNFADMVLIDGMPLMWIGKLFKTPFKEKISGSDLFPRVCEMASRKGYKVFFLGAAEGVAQIAANKLMKKFSGLNVVGTYSPSYGFEKDKKELKKIFDLIETYSPDIMCLGLGTPKQEKFIYKYLNHIKIPLTLCIGASIDFEAGKTKRSPKFLQNIGLEWFYRCCREPKRLAKRYVVDAIKIGPIVFKYYFKENNKIK